MAPRYLGWEAPHIATAAVQPCQQYDIAARPNDGVDQLAMEFAQYYSYDQPALQFADLSYYSSEPPLPPPQQHQQQHRFEPVPTTDIDYQNNQRHEETGTAMQKDSEEADTSSRPRLTTEQTNILEENFQKESKPVTEVKRQLAARVGLPLDKVNVSGLLMLSVIITLASSHTYIHHRTGTKTDGQRQSIFGNRRYWKSCMFTN